MPGVRRLRPTDGRRPPASRRRTSSSTPIGSPSQVNHSPRSCARRHPGPVLVLGRTPKAHAMLRRLKEDPDEERGRSAARIAVVALDEVARCPCQRAARPEPATVLRVGDVELSLEERTVRVGQHPPQVLTRTEMRLLAVLMRNSPAVVDRETLTTRVWDCPVTDTSNPVSVYVSRLRRKLEADPAQPRYLLTVPGLGYAFQPRSDAPGTTDAPADGGAAS